MKKEFTEILDNTALNQIKGGTDANKLVEADVTELSAQMLQLQTSKLLSKKD
ncbi:MAG: hypothetical protein ACEPOZ_09695 [Marinifilaceae bacterium]